MKDELRADLELLRSEARAHRHSKIRTSQGRWEAADYDEVIQAIEDAADRVLAALPVEDAFPHTCPCGLVHDEEQWRTLTFIGVMDDGVNLLEMRNCSCGSARAILVARESLAATAVGRALRERDRLFEALRASQHRCTELKEEVRRLEREIAGPLVRRPAGPPDEKTVWLIKGVPEGHRAYLKREIRVGDIIRNGDEIYVEPNPGHRPMSWREFDLEFDLSERMK